MLSLISLLQALTSEDEKLAKTMFLPLAERMVEKFIKDNTIDAEAGTVCTGLEIGKICSHIPQVKSSHNFVTATYVSVARAATYWIVLVAVSSPTVLQSLPNVLVSDFLVVWVARYSTCCLYIQM